MEFLLLICMIIIIVLLSNIRSGQKSAASENDKNFLSLKHDLHALKKQVLTPPPAKDIPERKSSEDIKPSFAPKAPIPDEKIPQQNQPWIRPSVTVSPTPAATPETEKVATESLWIKWLRNNPDLEKFIGENLINKVGIAVLVLGIGFFVKYAVDQDWINEAGRVAIGIFCGIILIGIAHRLRNSYRSFSSVLAGGGIAVFYFTIAFAFHEYGLFTQTTAFVIMIVITAFAVALSLLYNKIELAVIALVGGFLAPFMVSTGSNNYVALFNYLLILNTGMLIIAYFKKWPLLHVLAFFFTLLIFGGWMFTEYFIGNSTTQDVHRAALIFATGFYIIFLTAALIHNVRTKKPFKAFDFSLMIMITASYYGEGMTALHLLNGGAYQGLFTLVLAVLNLAIAWYLFTRQKGDRNLLYLLIGLTVTFISLSAPVQLHGHTITMFWSAEAVLLLWLHQRSGINTFKSFSALVLVAMMISLLIDWSIANEAIEGMLMIIFKDAQGIVTNLVAVISLVLYSFLSRKSAEEKYILGFKFKHIAALTSTTAIVILYATLIFLVNLQFINSKTIDVPNAFHQLISFGFLAILIFLNKRFKSVIKPPVIIALVFTAFLFYLVSYNNANDLLTAVIKGTQPVIYAGVHWLSVILLLYLFYQLIKIAQTNRAIPDKRFTWLMSIVLVLYFSIESKHLYVSALAAPGSISIFTSQYIKAGLTIVWALCSFVMMWLGMRHKFKTLRIISLTIFTAALMKLFLFDIRNISDGGKIVAFIMLGVLLLVISFMYQRLKKIIIDDENKKI